MSAFLAQPAPAPATRDAIFSPPPKAANLLQGAPSVSSDEAALSRLLGRGLQQAIPGSNLQWLLLPAAADADAAGAGDPARCLLLESGAGDLYLDDGARFLAGLTGIDGGACDGDWPQWMAGALAGRLAGTPLAGLRAIRRAAMPAADIVQLEWRLHQDGHAINVRAGASAASWLRLLAAATLTPLRMAWGQWLPLALNWPLVLAAHRLPAALFQTLAVGDIIVPDSAQFDCTGLGRVTLGRRRFEARFVAPHHLELLNEESPMHTDPIDDVVASGARNDYDEPDHDPDPGAGGDGDGDGDGEGEGEGMALPGAVHVTLRFELGQLRMTLDALRTLGPRSVFELHGATPHSIAIVCGQTEVGRGEVVDVDGRLGVRINAWGGAA